MGQAWVAVRVFARSLLIPLVAGHGSVVRPLPRQAVDADQAPWASGAVPEPVPRVSLPNEAGTWCPVAGASGARLGKYSANLAQSCFWFSNGCAIGCHACDGSTRGPEVGPEKRKVCATPMNATLCDERLRTVNTDAECGSAADRYAFTPWRAPGFAPVFDACGMAGGRAAGPGGHGAVYRNTSHAKQGDLGSAVLGALNTNTTWSAGDTVEVSWAITANHGGGYQYRLCPAGEPLNEACFQKTPLPFDRSRKQLFRWGGLDGTKAWFDGDYVSEGTNPPGSTWVKNPIPRNDGFTGAGFAPKCDEVPDCRTTAVESDCLCSGMWGPYNLEIVDYVTLPSSLAPGKYVLGWRWDCEESNQVWASCSDVQITAAHASK